MTDEGAPVRVARPADVDGIVAAMTTAFFHDPMWGPAFPAVDRRAVQAAALWRLFVTSGMRYPWTLVTPHVEAAALWIPPGGHELTDEEEADFGAFLTGVTGRQVADGIVDITDRLGAVHPAEPHFYLSLLATHDDHRGQGLGMGLLRENLDRIDAVGGAAYLESCNAGNNARYRSVGFETRDEVAIASGHVVTTMWRKPRPAAR